jgi:hypothetical protein
MGVFFDARVAQPKIEQAISSAFSSRPEVLQQPQEAAMTAARAVTSSAAVVEKQFNARNFLFALAIFLAIVVAAVVTDALKLPDSSKALWGLAASIFGVIVGLLGGEKSS